MPSTLRQNVALLKSEASRQLYVKEAQAKDQIYEFTDAWGEPARWLKGEYAYLAPNAASAFLNRLNLKHDTVDEEELRDSIREYQTLVIPNAARLEEATIGRIENRLRTRISFSWSRAGPISPAPSWVWSDPGWSGLRGTPAGRGPPAPPSATLPFGRTSTSRGPAARPSNGSRPPPAQRSLPASTRLPETSATPRRRPAAGLAPGIVLTGNTLYAANQVFEFLGGVLQAPPLRGRGPQLEQSRSIGGTRWSTSWPGS